jgi:hypothetical protein
MHDITEDFTRLEPEVVEHKKYAPGVGLIEDQKVKRRQRHREARQDRPVGWLRAVNGRRSLPGVQ